MEIGFDCFNIIKEEVVEDKKFVYLTNATYNYLVNTNRVEPDVNYCICDGLRICEVCGKEFPFHYSGYDFHICRDCKYALVHLVEDFNE